MDATTHSFASKAHRSEASLSSSMSLRHPPQKGWRQAVARASSSQVPPPSQLTQDVCGKRHHTYDATAPYPLHYEQSLLDLDILEQTFFLRATSGTPTVIDYPNGRAPTSYLDLGCGSGAWILAAAKAWPHCRFVGLDLVDIQPDLSYVDPSIGSRVQWVHANFLKTLPFPDAHFDHVSLRFIAQGVPENSWHDLLLEVHRVLKVGGAIEVVEEDMVFPVLPRCYTASPHTRHLNPLIMNRIPTKGSDKPSYTVSNAGERAFAFGATPSIATPSMESFSPKVDALLAQTAGLYMTLARGTSNANDPLWRPSAQPLAAHHQRTLTSGSMLRKSTHANSDTGYRSQSFVGPSQTAVSVVHNNLALQKPKQKMVKPQPHDHFVLERLFCRVFDTRHINMKPTAILPNLLNTYFRGVHSSSVVNFPMPPPPKSALYHDDTDKRLDKPHTAISLNSPLPSPMHKSRRSSTSSTDSIHTPSLYASSSSSLPSPFLTLPFPVTSASILGMDLNTPSSGSPSVGPLSSVSSSLNHDGLLGKLYDLPEGRFRSQTVPTSRLPASGTSHRGYDSQSSRLSFSTVRTDGSTTSYHSPSALLKPYFGGTNDEPTDGTPIAAPDDRRTTLHFQRAWEGVLACKEAMFDELLRSQNGSQDRGTLLDELWWDPQHEKKDLREKFEVIVDRFESDMRSRTGITDALETGISWSPPAMPLSAGEKKWREDVRKERAEAKRLELESAKRRAEIEDCDHREFMADERAARMLRVFVATRGPGP